MKLIAHRGNIWGPDPKTENNPEQVLKCIEEGYNVEIDIRYEPKSETLWLGHDEAQYKVSWWWLAGKSSYLWIHCKDLITLYEFVRKTSGYNYFWHQKDYFTLTSKQFIWTYPGQPYTSSSVIVMPEWGKNPDWDRLRVTNCYGICSDYVGELK
jgi:hypothetical protein